MIRNLTPSELALWAALPMAHTTHIERRLKMILDHTRPRRALSRRALLLALTPGAVALVTLSMLRPAARAQTAPAPVAATPAAPPTAPVPLTKLPVSQQTHKASAAPLPVAVSKSAPPAVAPVSPPAAENQAVPPSLEPVGVAPRKAVLRAAQLPPAASPVPVLPSAVPADAPSSLPKLSSADLLPPSGASARSVFTEDGFTVDFLGTTDADKPGAPWWSNSGALLARPIYDTTAHRAESHAFGGGTKNVLFAFRLPANGGAITVAYKASGALSSSSEGSWLYKMQSQQHRTEAQSHSQTGGARVLTAAFPSSLTKTDVQLGIASGPWKVAATYGADALDRVGGSSIRQGNSTFIFSPAAETKGGTVLSIATDATEDLRVVAVNAQGQELLPEQIGDNSMGALDQITARFDLPLSQLKEIHVETRPFRWVEFRDIALQPVG